MPAKPVDHSETIDRNKGCINGTNGDNGKYRNDPIGKDRKAPAALFLILNIATALTVFADRAVAVFSFVAV